MKITWIIFVFFGVLLFVFPELLSYLLGGFFVIIGITIFIVGLKLRKHAHNTERYVKFGNFKIYR